MLLVDLSSGRVVHDIRLDNVRSGFPALAWDLPRDRLYVVHEAGDEVTVVDLAEGRVIQEGTVESRLSLGERIGRRLFPVVKAKEFRPGISLQAAVSGDGTRLSVTGRRWESAQLPDGTTSFRGTPLGLSVISTPDLTEQGRLDLPVDHLKLSPDGRHAYVRQAGDGGGYALRVLDLASRRFVAEREYVDNFTVYPLTP